MMDEQGTRTAVLVEDMDRRLKAVAESTGAVAAALADLKDTFSRRFDALDVKFVGMTIEIRDLKAEVGTLGTEVGTLGTEVGTLGTKVDRLEAFASEAGPRLVRIETQLSLPASPPRRKPTRPTPPTHHRRKPAKRT
jgi:hypothetical protein